MRIVAVRAHVLKAAVSDGIAMSFAPLAQRSGVLIEVETEDGLTGCGESWVNFPAWAAEERVATLRDGVFPLLLGEDADAVRNVHAKLIERLEPLGRQWGAPGPIMQAISGVDIALWDRLGQAAGRSFAELVGGRCRDVVPVYASSLGPDGVADQASSCRADGLLAMKVKVGFGRARDAENLRLAREAAGPDAVLFADANQAWTVAEALVMAPVLEKFGVAWLEEPIRGNRLEDLEALHHKTGLMLATGENLYGQDAFWSFAASPAVAILQPDVSKAGGLTVAMAVCEMAAARGKVVAPHLYGGAVAFAASMQLAAAMPQATLLEYDVRANPLRDALIVDPPRPAGGVLRIPSGPGLGIRLRRDAVAAHTVRSVKAGPDRD